jgi:hypothetical protein
MRSVSILRAVVYARRYSGMRNVCALNFISWRTARRLLLRYGKESPEWLRDRTPARGIICGGG